MEKRNDKKYGGREEKVRSRTREEREEIKK